MFSSCFFKAWLFWVTWQNLVLLKIGSFEDALLEIFWAYFLVADAVEFRLQAIIYYSWNFSVLQSQCPQLSLLVHLLDPFGSKASRSLQVFKPLLLLGRPLGLEQAQNDCSVFQSESNHLAHMKETSWNSLRLQRYEKVTFLGSGQTAHSPLQLSTPGHLVSPLHHRLPNTESKRLVVRNQKSCTLRVDPVVFLR